MPRKIKILISSYDYKPRVGGISTVTFELAKALQALPNVEIRLLAPSSGSTELDQSMDQHGFFETMRIPLPKRSERAVWGISKAIRREARIWSPDAILNLMWLPCGLASWLVTRNYSVPYSIPYFIMTHGVEILESSQTLRKRIRGFLRCLKVRAFRHSAGVFSVSQFTAQLVISECGVDPHKVKVVHNGVDSQVFFPGPKPLDLVQKLGLDQKFVFLTVSRLDDYKGIDKALLAFPSLLKKHSHAVYIVCGEGPDRPRVERLAADLGIQEQVKFTGRIEEGRLRDYFNLADVFVLLSRDDRVTPNFEGFGLVYLEAAACGKPSLAGKSGGVPEVVIEGETGWLVPPEDIPAISAAMCQAIEDEVLRKRMGEAAYQRAVNHYSWNSMAAKILEEMRKHVRN